jgi:hypothetical protein
MLILLRTELSHNFDKSYYLEEKYLNNLTQDNINIISNIIQKSLVEKLGYSML